MAKLTTQADKAALFNCLAGCYERGATKETKAAERDKLNARAEAARTHAETYPQP